MYDLISIGGISIDFYFKGDSLTYQDNRFQLAVGGKYLASDFYYSVGGGGANVAIAAAKTGISVAVYGMIGNNQFKNMILKELDDKNVKYSLCPVTNNYFNFSSILLNEKGERSIINYVTPHLNLFENNYDINHLLHTKLLFLGNLPDVSITHRLHLLSHIKHSNITTALNFGIKDCRRPKDQLKEIFNKVDILICNGHEFAEIVKAPYQDINFKENIVEHYIPFLKNKIVLVTEGEKGSYVYQNDNIFHQKAIKPSRIIDTTGAGDAFTGAFLAEFIKSSKISRALEKGSLYASKILSKIGAN